MVRGWIGVGILVVFLVLGVVTGVAMDDAHLPTGALLEQAVEKAFSGDFAGAVDLGLQAKTRWENTWNATATMADQSPMDDVDDLFAEMEIYARTGEEPHFAACCKELARRIEAIADAHRFRWWSVL